VPIRALYFDVGGIFYCEKDKTPVKEWERYLGLTEGQLQRIVFQSPFAEQAWMGQATGDDVWNDAATHLTISPEDLTKLKDDFWSGWVWDTELIAYVHALKSQYKLGVISDAWPGVREGIEEYINDDTFDLRVFSYEEGILKPHPEIYQRALSRLEALPEEALFLDDQLKNVEGAQAIGMAGAHITDPQKQVGDIINKLS
jgi:HAD superfamily hydrolase (TIGR01509 family)